MPAHFRRRMAQPPIDPGNIPLEPDEFDRLGETLKRMLEKQEAWRKLLENLDELKKDPPENPEPTTPST